MWRVDQAERFEVRHHVAHRGRRQRHRDQARDIARAHRLAGREKTLDDLTKNVARALVELGQTGIRSDQANRIVVGHQLFPPRPSNLSIPEAGDKRALAVKRLAAPLSPTYKHREPTFA